MLPKTISLTETETERCECCGGDSAVRTSEDPDENPLIGHFSDDSDINLDMVECHFCGYAWYEVRVERTGSPSVINMIHDVSVGVPGQPKSATSREKVQPILVTVKPTSDMMVEKIRDIDSWMRHYLLPVMGGAQQKVMTESLFNEMLEKRMESRRAAACQ